MNTFLTLLATFYMCDAMAEAGPLDDATQLRCAAAYETLKIGFLTDEERDALGEFGFARVAEAHQAMLRFRDWEHDHDELVTLLKKAVSTGCHMSDATVPSHSSP